MAIKDIANSVKEKATDTYNYSVDRGRAIYDASKPYAGASKSIIAAAKGNLFEFPVFISSSVQLDYASATTSLLEQVYASYLQSAISLNPVVDHHLVANKTPFAKFQSDTNRYVEYCDPNEMDYAHDAVHNEFTTEEGFLEFDMASIEDHDAGIILEQYNKQPLSEFSHYFLESKSQEREIERLNKAIEKLEQKIKNLQDEDSERNRNLSQREAAVNAKADMLKGADKDLKEAKELRDRVEELKNDINSTVSFEKQRRAIEAAEKKLDEEKKKLDLDNKKFKYQKSKDARDEKYRKDRDAVNDAKDERKEAFEKEKHEYQKDKDAYEARRNAIDDNFKHAVKAPEMLDDSKVKKLNTMKPLMMNVTFNIKADDGTISAPINYVIAVKTFNRIIDADVLPNVATYPLKEMNKISRKAKWRAGELKFFRDIVFKIKEKKQTAIDSKDPKHKWYRRLYELAHMTGDAPTKAALKGKNITWSVVKSQIEHDFDYGVIPNSSLIISSNDVINVKSQTSIDLLNGATATKLCKELGLISMIVIDTDAESIKILLPDNHSDYEVHSLASVNKQLAELSTAGSKTRDIFKLLG